MARATSNLVRVGYPAGLASAPKQVEMSLGDFPGRKSGLKGDLAPRLSVAITVQICDRATGQVFKTLVPFDTNESVEVVPWARAALAHKRTLRDIESFVEGRDGGAGSMEDEPDMRDSEDEFA